MNFDKLLKSAEEKDRIKPALTNVTEYGERIEVSQPTSNKVDFGSMLQNAISKDKGITTPAIKTDLPTTLPKPLSRISPQGELTNEALKLRSLKSPLQQQEDIATMNVLPSAIGTGLLKAGESLVKSPAYAVAGIMTSEGDSKRYEEANKYKPSLSKLSPETLQSAQRIADATSKFNVYPESVRNFMNKTQDTVSNFQTTGNRLLGQTAIAGGQMIPTMLTGGLAGAGAGLGVMGAGVYSQSMGEALKKGNNVKKSAGYALGQTAIEVGTEKLFGGIPGLGKGIVSSVIGNKLAKSVGTSTASKLLASIGKSVVNKKALGVIGEGFEEVLAEYLSPFVERATIDPNASDATLAQMAESFVSGALLSAVLQGGSLVLSSGKTISKVEDIQTLTKKEKQEFDTELERLAYESNVRKGKITPQGETIQSYSADWIADNYGLPTPTDKANKYNVKTHKLKSGKGLVGNEAYKAAKIIYENKVNELTDYIKNYTPKGTETSYVDQEGYGVNPNTDIVYGANRVSVSNNDIWYQDFWKENGRKPNKGEAKELATKIINDSLLYEKDDGLAYDENFNELVRSISPNSSEAPLNILQNADSDSRKYELSDPFLDSLFSEQKSEKTTSDIPRLNKPTDIYAQAKGQREIPRTITPFEQSRLGATTPLQAPILPVQTSKAELGSELPKATNTLIKSIEKNKGVKVVYADLPSGVNGSYNNGVITIAKGTKNPIEQVLKHELTHHIETSGQYANLSNFIRTSLKDMGLNVDEISNGIKNDYAQQGTTLTPEQIDKEFVAKFSEEYLFTDEKSIQRLSMENPNLFRKIYEWISDNIKKLGSSAETRFLIDAQRKYERALRTAKQTNSGTQFSMGKPLSKEQELFFKDSKARDDSGNLIAAYHGTNRGDFNIFSLGEKKFNAEDPQTGFFFTDSMRTAKEYAAAYEPNRRIHSPHVKNVYLNLKNPLVIDNKGGSFYVSYKGRPMKTDNLAVIAKKDGYDGVIIKNIRDSIYNPIPTTTLIAFYPNQIKSVDNLNPTENPNISLSQGKKLAEYSSNPNVLSKLQPKPLTTLPIKETKPLNTLPKKPKFDINTGLPLNTPPTKQTKPTWTEMPEDVKQEIKTIAPQLKDISGHFGQTNDIWEIFKKGFGKFSGYMKEQYLDPFAISKGEAANFEIQEAKEVGEKVIKRLGIKKGSEESKAIRYFGEGKKFIKNAIDPQTKRVIKGWTEIDYTLENLKQDFPNKWQQIVEADKFFRSKYDNFIDEINAMKEVIYPNAEINFDKITKRIERVKAGEDRYKDYTSLEKSDLVKQLLSEQDQYITGKRIPRRKDYYRHYTEMKEGFAALKNIVDTPAQIGSNLQGISQFTKPKSKWESFAQHRKGELSDADAIGGYLDYLPAASYAIHIDPHIAKFRELRSVLAEATTETNNAGNLIRTIHEYTDSLAGKTNKWDRIFEDMPGGRKFLRGMNWLNNRVKANVILGNIASSVSQFANMPAGIAYIKDPQSLGRGLYYTFKGSDAIKKSPFMTERFKGDVSAQFNEGMLKKPKQFAQWMLSAADGVGSTFIWNSAYQKALKNGSKNPTMEADDITRTLVAGRGIGEVPLNQQRNLTKLVAPFTLEVQNMWRIQKNFVNEKDFGGLLIFYFLSWAFNDLSEEVRGNRILFDPIDAMYEAVTEADLSPIERVGRLGGEALSNIPYGSTLASLYPEYGIQINEELKSPTREKLFGDTDPTRYGSGLVSQQALTDPIFKLLPSWGGGQLKKTYDFLKSEQMLPNLSPTSKEFLKKQDLPASIKNDKLKFVLGKSPETLIKGTLFGSYATDEGKDYIEKGTHPLGTVQTENFKEIAKQLGDNKLTKEVFDFIAENRSLTSKDERVKALSRSKLNEKQKRLLYSKFYGYK